MAHFCIKGEEKGCVMVYLLHLSLLTDRVIIAFC